MEDKIVDEAKQRALARIVHRRHVKEEYGLFFNEVTQILYRHDYMGLATLSCPEDEYEPEAETIIPRLREAHSPGELSVIVEEEFTRWFNPMSSGPKEWYTAVADDLWMAWQRYTAQ